MQEPYYAEKDLEMKRKIFEAFRLLVEQEPTRSVDAISVSAICSQADISRPTFYYHFSDKYSLIVWFMEIMGANSIGQIGLTISLDNAFRLWNANIMKYQAFFSACIKSKHYGEIYAYMVSLMRDGITETLKPRFEEGIPDTLSFCIDYYVVALEAAQIDLINGRLECSVDEFARYAIALMPGRLRKELDEPIRGLGSIPFVDTVKTQGSEDLFKRIRESRSDLGMKKRPDGGRLRTV